MRTEVTAPAVREMVKEMALMGETTGQARGDHAGEVHARSRVSELV